MSYPGDPALAPDVQQRILTTFQQTLELASKGSRQEALLGCDFILRLDPHYGPARTLQQLVNAGRSGPQLAELLGTVGEVSVPAAAAPAASDDADLESFADLALELPAAPPPREPGGAGLAAEIERLFASRSFVELLQIAEQNRRAIAGDPKLRQLIDQAQSRLEADPYVRTFLESARQAVQVGELEEAERLLRKARSLDPSHPGIAELEEARKLYDDPERTLGARRRGIQMEETLEAAAPVDSDQPSLELPEVDFSFATSDGESFNLQDETGGGSGSDVEAGGGRIEQLLGEGQAAFDRGEYQGAIDAWSRIFLIDIDHQEAARRIEQARQLKAERERETEEIFHEGAERFDAGDLAAAEAAFRRVVEIAPGHVLAVEFLERIEARREGGAAPVVPPAAERVAGEEPRAAATAPSRAPREKMTGEILVPPEPGTGRMRDEERAAFAVAAKRRSGPAPNFLLIGGLVLALLAVGGWLLLNNRARLFPNSQVTPQTPAPAVADPIARAKALAADGKTAIAIAQLRRLPPQDAQYAEAQSLISQWEALVQPAAPVPAGPTPEEKARRSALVGEAEQACQQQEFLRCQRLLAKAAEMAPLDAQLSGLAAHAGERLAPLAGELKMYQDGDYEFLLNALWRKREDEPANRDIKRLIIDSYYNLGVLELQRGDPAAAAERFREAVTLDANDAELARLQAFSHAYTRRNEDLLYQIYVKYLAVR